jgi:hypothetical protein
MVTAPIRTKIEKNLSPAAPLDDEAKIQYPIDKLLGRMFDSPRIEVPDQILLGSLRDGRLKVRSPIKVRFATEGKHTIAEAMEINEFGFGENISEAIADLQHTIAELYLTLEEEQDRLGTDLQGVWAILQEKIYKR